MNILVLNPGSSTLKFGLYQMPKPIEVSTRRNSVRVLASGIVESIGPPPSTIRIFGATPDPIIESIDATTPARAAEQAISRIRACAGENVDAVGCRVVHGGARLVKPTIVTSSVLHELRALQELAPLHNPASVAVLEQVTRLLPDIPLVAVFDTAFHQTMPSVAFTYALPVELCARHGLRRYGFHGISHAYVSAQLIERLGRGTKGSKIITCHLGNGASVCAVRDGQSVDVSMGLTPLEGLVMGTRSGDVDPGLLLFLMRGAGMTASEVDDLLNHQSGLLGVSGLSADVRLLEQAALEGNQRAELALEVFAYRTCKYIGAFAAVLEGLDALAFTGGIGQHSASMRARITRRLTFLGIALDDARNRAATGNVGTLISTDHFAVQVWVIPTDEERQIAFATHEAMQTEVH